MMDKEIIVQFDEDVYREYEALKESDRKTKPTPEQLLNSINTNLKRLKNNYKFGDLILRKYLSKKVIDKYGTDKIFRVELVGYWRLLFTIIGDKNQITVLILDYMDHDKYNQLFGYRKR